MRYDEGIMRSCYATTFVLLEWNKMKNAMMFNTWTFKSFPCLLDLETIDHTVMDYSSSSY